MPRLLSLFDGTSSLTQPFHEKNWDITTLDLDPKHGPTICCNILKWDYIKEEPYDVIFAGCPCEQYSIARTTAKTPRNFELADRIVPRTLEITNTKLNPNLKYFIKSLDTSLLWGRPVTNCISKRIRLDYCQYGFQNISELHKEVQANILQSQIFLLWTNFMDIRRRSAPSCVRSCLNKMISILNGLSQRDFTHLRVLHNGQMTDILTLFGSGGSGSGTVTSATLPLSINNGVLSLDLSGFCTSVSSPLALTNGLRINNRSF